MSVRVTEVLDYFAEPYLVKWKLKNKDWETVGKEALRIGSLIDKMVQDDLNGLLTSYPSDPTIDNCVKAWVKFRAERPDVIEKLVKFRGNMQRELVLGELVGHPDFILDDEIIDLKTSKQVSKSHWMQTSQYANMENFHRMRTSTKRDPMGGHLIWENIQRISILRLDKLTGEYEYRTLEEPFITFWQRKFQCRYEAFKEDAEFAEMMRVKLEEEKLG